MLAIDEILASRRGEPAGLEIGRSREGRPIRGHRFGGGRARVSLVGGCHADEPVGPAMLGRLAGWLATRPGTDPLLAELSWFVVPHVNPDGAARNAAWSEPTTAVTDCRGRPGLGFDLVAYLRRAVREAPGDDIEFGFPRHPGDTGARPENRAVASFLAAGAPFALHGSFHGMGFAPGPWFLIEPTWVDRTVELRAALRRQVAAMGYAPFDVDRKGEKGFYRIDEGFSTRPDSGAMAAHFEHRGDPATASLFRPSSMEHVRSLGGDPFTFVSEMPLFLLPDDGSTPGSGHDGESRARFRSWLAELAAGAGDPKAAAGIRPMPVGDQMRLQLHLLAAALAVAV